ncbi:hypothetical protein TNCV_2452131 [Trichonephila clavipes]|nr:hypothetical protein TNCV_2452131 [Trichonephila clavipes]
MLKEHSSVQKLWVMNSYKPMVAMAVFLVFLAIVIFSDGYAFTRSILKIFFILQMTLKSLNLELDIDLINTSSSFQEPSQRFDHVHLDLIGPLPPLKLHLFPDNRLDCFSAARDHATSHSDITARETQAEAFFSPLSAFLNSCNLLTTDRGSAGSWSPLLFKDSNFWDHYSTARRCLTPFLPDDDVVEFTETCLICKITVPKPPKHHGKRPVFGPSRTDGATHVFLRRDMLRRPLQQTPRLALSKSYSRRTAKPLDINKRVSVSIDGCKPAFLNTRTVVNFVVQTKNETPATVELQCNIQQHFYSGT